MLHQYLFENSRFWKVIRYLENLKSRIALEDCCRFLEVEKDQILKGVLYLQKFEHSITLIKKTNRKIYVVPPKKKKKIAIELSLLEWLSFQSCIPHFEDLKNTDCLRDLRKKILKFEGIYNKKSVVDVETEVTSLWNKKISINKKKVRSKIIKKRKIERILNEIELSIAKSNILIIQKINENPKEVSPHRLVHLDGELNLVCEDTKNRSLSSFELSKIQSLKRIRDHEYQNNYTKNEVSDFIDAIRAVSGNEIRLVLKVSSFEKINSSPLYHYLSNPYITTNNKGDIIWAATIEPCEQIFKWLFELGDEAEIIDPEEFKMEFQGYCQHIDQK